MKMEKINIAELLKDCPKDMELYSPICGKCNFNYIQFTDSIIKVSNKTGVYSFAKDGTYTRAIDAECLLFPSKDNRDWSTFQRPFKDGDIVATSSGAWIGITTGGKSGEFMPTYCVITGDGEFEVYFNKKETWQFHRLATEEEKAKLFDTIKANGYKWNEETKTLEKLFEPKFNIGDRVKKKDSNEDVVLITDIADNYYIVETKYGMEVTISISIQNDYELVPNKFDINTLIPFESKVLVRNDKHSIWKPAIFGCYMKDETLPYYVLGGICWKQCIPYNEETKRLSGTTYDCVEFYKNWKE